MSSAGDHFADGQVNLITLVNLNHVSSEDDDKAFIIVGIVIMQLILRSPFIQLQVVTCVFNCFFVIALKVFILFSER